MDEFAFPRDLVEALLAHWGREAESGIEPPLLPSRNQLLQLIEVAYVASLETNEARPITFTLCCTPDTDSVRRSEDEAEVEAWLFEPHRRFDVQEVAGLAIATNLNSAAVWVQFSEAGDRPLEIRGLLNLGFTWALARHGFSTRYESLPRALTIRVDGPGSLTVYQNQTALLALSSGRLQRSQSLPASLQGARGLFEEGIAHFRERLQNGHPLEERSVSLLELSYLNVLITIINSIKHLRHGGALIFLGKESDVLTSGRDLVKPKYRLGGSAAYLSDHFFGMMSARLTRAKLANELEKEPLDGISASDYGLRLQQLHLLDLEIRSSSQRLAEASNFVANLSGTDGAIVMRSDLSLVGFGAEIILEAIAARPVYEVWDAGLRAGRPLEAEQFGMRHRSAMRLCAASHDVSVFVVSQDGGVSLVFSLEDKVYIRRNITTVNANM